MNQPTLAQAYQYYQQQLFNNALTTIDAVLVAEAGNAEAHNLRGAVLERMGRPTEALAAYETAVRINPKYQAAADNALELQQRRQRSSGTGGSRLATLLTGLAAVSTVVVGCSTLFLWLDSTRYGWDFEDIVGPLVIGILGASLILLLLALAQTLKALARVEATQAQTATQLGALMAELRVKGTESEVAPPRTIPEV